MRTSPFSVRRFLVIFIIAWAILMVDHAMVLHWFGLSWEASAYDSLISNILLLAVCLLVMNTLRYYVPAMDQYINVLVICIVFAVFWMVLSKWILRISLGDYDDYSSFLHRSMAIRFSIGFLILGIMSMTSIIWFNWQEQQKTEQRKSDAEKLTREAELFKLRQQLQPHFLFNSLNSINALIGSRPQEARRMVQQLSDFLRGTLRKEETQWVSLQEELQYLELYLEIEKVRFGNRLETRIESDEVARQMKLPALLLQPLVENAIKFGLYDTTGVTLITLLAEKQGNELVIKVSNPFDPETSSPRQGTGFGLKSVHRRLYLLFARSDLLITRAKENIFITIVKVPQLDPKNEST